MTRSTSLYRHIAVVTLAILLAALSPILFGGSALAADDGTKQIGVVVSFPDGTEHLEVVMVPTNATAFDVLQAAKLGLASQTTDFGPAICGINKIGCSSDDCFCDKAHFWAYYHLDPATNKWQASAQGVGAYVPVNGAVEGFMWSAMDANFQPTDQPKVHTFQELSGGAPQGLPKTGYGVGLIGLGCSLILLGAGLLSRAARGQRFAASRDVGGAAS